MWCEIWIEAIQEGILVSAMWRYTRIEVWWYCILVLIYVNIWVYVCRNVPGKEIESEHEFKKVPRKSEETTRKGGGEGMYAILFLQALLVLVCLLFWSILDKIILFRTFLQINTVAKSAGINHNLWIENADRLVAGFLEMFEEGFHKMVRSSLTHWC